MDGRRLKAKARTRRRRAAVTVLLALALLAVVPPAAQAVNEFPDAPSAPAPGGTAVKPLRPYIPHIAVPRCPKLIGQPLDAARKIAAAERVTLNPITYRPADGTPGVIVDQAATARRGDDVYLCAVVVSQPWTVVVPNLVGMTVDAAPAALRDPGYHNMLALARQRQLSESDRPPGTILSQTPAPGTKVTTPTLIGVVVATPPAYVVVPQLVGSNVRDAPAALGDARFRQLLSLARQVERREADAPTGTILAQNPAAGTRVKVPTAIVVAVAVPRPRVLVPDLTALTPPAAGQELRAEKYRGLLGLGAQYRRPSSAQAGTIVGQKPPPNTPVTAPTLIEVWIAEALPAVVVPNLTTLTPTVAGQELRAEKYRGLLDLGAQHRRPSSARAGTIVAQKPAPNTPVTAPTRIELWVAEAPPAVVVPSLVDFKPPDAKARLAAETFGGLLSLGSIGERESDKPEGVIVEQKPVAGAKVSVATPIDVWVAKARLVVVPNLATLTRDGALVALTKVGLTLGNARSERRDGRSGSIVGQNPEAGRRVPTGTPISIVLVATPTAFKLWHLVAAVLVVLLTLAAGALWRHWRTRLPGLSYRAQRGLPEVSLEAPAGGGGAVRLRADRGPHETTMTDDEESPRRKPWPKTT
jgi:beta-lactam-binding protein with PASTA domain